MPETFLPCVVEAVHEGGFKIRLTFHDGTRAIVDFQRWLDGPIFEPLKKPSFFRQFFIEGGTVVWPNGADIAPETLYEAAEAARLAVPTRAQTTGRAKRRS